MSRLIDADKLKVYLKEYLHYDHAIPWVDAQPTAYDIEKVVEKLRPLSFRLPKDYCGLDGKDRVVMFEDAIEIVRKGGVE